MLAYRRELLHGRSSFTWLDGGDDTVMFRRGEDWICVTNMGTHDVALPPGRLVLTTSGVDEEGLPPNASAWLLREEEHARA